ncbi:hypothetical protein PUN28_015496 [Cardiocondyla obscurior]|uniref:Uncharacterized protein n=1 Tax=Cardiocondyla obscurior TaxID=286306 RepID=A0AAW2EX32_9HYME
MSRLNSASSFANQPLDKLGNPLSSPCIQTYLNFFHRALVYCFVGPDRHGNVSTCVCLHRPVVLALQVRMVEDARAADGKNRFAWRIRQSSELCVRSEYNSKQVRDEKRLDVYLYTRSALDSDQTIDTRQSAFISAIVGRRRSLTVFNSPACEKHTRLLIESRGRSFIKSLHARKLFSFT